jgi:hypothetical protein
MLRVDIGELPLWMELILSNIAVEKGGDGASSNGSKRGSVFLLPSFFYK